jgi:hypothetical protein
MSTANRQPVRCLFPLSAAKPPLLRLRPDLPVPGSVQTTSGATNSCFAASAAVALLPPGCTGAMPW